MVGAKEECRHFNGVGLLDPDKRCRAGVRYRDVRDASGPGMARWPCLTLAHGPAATVCSLRSLLTAEEQALQEAEIRKALDEAVAKINAGLCHVCGVKVERRHRVGRCEYAGPCGHRIGQVADEDEP